MHTEFCFGWYLNTVIKAIQIGTCFPVVLICSFFLFPHRWFLGWSSALVASTVNRYRLRTLLSLHEIFCPCPEWDAATLEDSGFSMQYLKKADLWLWGTVLCGRHYFRVVVSSKHRATVLLIILGRLTSQLKWNSSAASNHTSLSWWAMIPPLPFLPGKDEKSCVWLLREAYCVAWSGIHPCSPRTVIMIRITCLFFSCTCMCRKCSVQDNFSKHTIPAA